MYPPTSYPLVYAYTPTRGRLNTEKFASTGDRDTNFWVYPVRA